MTADEKRQKFLNCGKARLTREEKVSIAMAVYLTLEAINEMAPTGCDGKPAELAVEVGNEMVAIQPLLTEILNRLGAPVPDLPEAEPQEGFCACGNELEEEDYH